MPADVADIEAAAKRLQQVLRVTCAKELVSVVPRVKMSAFFIAVYLKVPVDDGRIQENWEGFLVSKIAPLPGEIVEENRPEDT